MAEFKEELQQLINRWSRENVSNTPDFLLARYIEGCLEQAENMIRDRDRWYGVYLRPGWTGTERLSLTKTD